MGYAGMTCPKKLSPSICCAPPPRPDDQRVCETEFGLLGFGRLAIMGLTPEGMQPFFRGTDCVACNGELYGFRPVKKELEAEATPSSRIPTVRSSCRCTTSTGWICSSTWTQSLP